MCAALIVKVAGVEGVEPSQTEPESVVLPLYDTPSAFPDARVAIPQRLSASEYIRDEIPVRQPLFPTFLKKVCEKKIGREKRRRKRGKPRLESAAKTRCGAGRDAARVRSSTAAARRKRGEGQSAAEAHRSAARQGCDAVRIEARRGRGAAGHGADAVRDAAGARRTRSTRDAARQGRDARRAPGRWRDQRCAHI